MNLAHYGYFIPADPVSVRPREVKRSRELRVARHARGLERAGRPQDELANFVTHCLGFVLSLAGSWLMMKIVLNSGDFWTILGCGAYCASLVSLYAASALSHAFYNVHRRHFYRKVDQVCIFYLIAGTFTPYAAVYLRGGWWPLLTITMWTLATIGMWTIWHRGFLSATGQKIYLLLGWLPAISLPTLIAVAPSPVIFWTILGGFCYTIGTIFLWHDHRVRFFHATWHTLVIAGSTSHFIAILLTIVY